MAGSKVSIGGGNFPASHGDGRGDLGYGRLNPKYHVPKMLGNDIYPYRDVDEDLSDLETFNQSFTGEKNYINQKMLKM